jgi:DNA-directed RNA polymerase subunit RPC12/RpoP
MLKRGFYVCASDACDFEVTKGEVLWGLSDVIVRVEEEPVGLECCECGSKTEKFEYVEKYYCPHCAGLLLYEERVVPNDNKPEVMGTPYATPIHSDALALTSENVAEHKEKFPDIEIDSENRPVFTNARQHDDYMQKCGIKKQVQKTGRSKGKIYSYPGSKCS